ncbi:MAG TPA: YdeI/OmpD-associated family protein, partial [Phenylobacterium sp.]
QYAYERPLAELSSEELATFRADARAWAWFEAAAPSYRKVALNWVVSARKAETRARRLQALIADSADGRKIGPMRIGRDPS